MSQHPNIPPAVNGAEVRLDILISRMSELERAIQALVEEMRRLKSKSK